jgi:hypothetical protein
MNPPDQPIEQTGSVGGARPATDGPQTACCNQSIGAAQEQAAELHQELLDQQKQAGYSMNEAHIKRAIIIRDQLEDILEQMKTLLDSREVAMAYARVQEGAMWLTVEIVDSRKPEK